MKAERRKNDMKPCVIVVHRNYAEGEDAYAFWSEDDARKASMKTWTRR